MAGVQEELKELRDKLQMLRNFLKCPVCLEVLHKHNITCINGHSICQKCIGEQQNCPTCREDFSNIKRNIMVRQVLEVLSWKCKHGTCDYRVLPGDDHENYCCYRLTPCKIEGCGEKVPVNELSVHLTNEHAIMIITPSVTNYRAVHADFDPDKYCSLINIYSIFGHYIWQIRSNDPKTGLLTYTYIPVLMEKPLHDILFTRSFVSHKMKYDLTIRIIMNEFIDHKKESVISVPSSMLYPFWNKAAQTLGFDLRIVKAND